MKKKRVAGTAAVGGVVAACIFLGSQFGLDFGGSGLGLGGNGGTGGTALEQESTAAEESRAQDSAEKETNQGTVANVITIRVVKDQVFVNDGEYADAEALRAYLEEAYDDEKIVELIDEQSILAAYEWVQGVLDELEIPVVEKTE